MSSKNVFSKQISTTLSCIKVNIHSNNNASNNASNNVESIVIEVLILVRAEVKQLVLPQGSLLS